MRIAVNAAALRSAGGRSVAFNFLRAFRENPRDHQLHVFAPAGCGYEEFLNCRQIYVHIVPPRFNKPWFRLLLDRYWLHREVEAVDPDVIFSMGNIAVPTTRRQLVMFQWAYATYPNSPVWQRMSWQDVLSRRTRISLFRKRLQYATMVAPQTQIGADRLRKYYPEIRELAVVPSAVALSRYQKPLAPEVVQRLKGLDGITKLLCLARYYPHKNLGILLDVAEAVKRTNKPFRIITTISPDQHPEAADMLKEAKRRGLEDVMVNVGPIAMDEVPALYQHTDALLMPTLLESFGLIYADAMYFRKPVFTSDLDFARDMCADTAYYFDPHDAADMLSVIETAFSDEQAMKEKTAAAHDRVLQLPDWHRVTGLYLDLLENMVHKSD